MSVHLQRLQDALQRSILTGATDDALVCGQGARDRSARLGIYAYAYRARLHDALADNYPVLQAHVGPDEFAALARGYIDAYPSRDFSVRNFGSHLPQWLESQRPTEPWLSELASFEWTLGCVFDAPDGPSLSADTLSGIGAQEWPELMFRFASHVRLLALETNAQQLYECAARGQPAAGRRETSTIEWLIWRRSLTTHYRSLARFEAIALTTLLEGLPFADACERLLEHCSAEDVPFRAAACLKRWLADELIVGLGQTSARDDDARSPATRSGLPATHPPLNRERQP